MTAPKACVKCAGPITTPLLVGDKRCVHCADYDPNDPDVAEVHARERARSAARWSRVVPS